MRGTAFWKEKLHKKWRRRALKAEAENARLRSELEKLNSDWDMDVQTMHDMAADLETGTGRLQKLVEAANKFSDAWLSWAITSNPIMQHDRFMHMNEARDAMIAVLQEIPKPPKQETQWIVPDADCCHDSCISIAPPTLEVKNDCSD